MSDYNHAISVKSNLAEAYDNRGALKETRGDWDGARADYSMAIELKPTLAEAYANRGRVKLYADDFNGARADFFHAVEMAPQLKTTISSGFRLLGCAEYDRHLLSECLADFQKAAQLDPSDYRSHFRLWLARSMLGEKATPDLKKYLTQRDTLEPDEWCSSLGRFLVGELTEQELLQTSRNTEPRVETSQKCEAQFYAGTKHLLSGDMGLAQNCFEKSIATGAKDLAEYMSAAAELKDLRGQSRSEVKGANLKH